jgi:hypothetical protein
MTLQLHKIKPDNYPSVINRIEDCLVRAYSEKAKRRLFFAACEVAYLDFSYAQYINDKKKGWSWQLLINPFKTLNNRRERK